MLYGFMQNHAGPKNMWKKIRKTGAGQSSMGGKKTPAGCFVPCIASVNFVCLKQRMQKPCFGLVEGLLNH
jgi:hypothetical protein